MNTAMIYVSTWRERLGWRLFPSAHLESPEWVPNSRDPNFNLRPSDVVVCHVQSEFSFLERLRILFSGRVETIVKIATQNVVGSTATLAQATPRPPRWMTQEP